MGFALTHAQSWLAKRSKDLPAADRRFIELSRKVAKRRRYRVRALVGVVAVPMFLILVVLGVAGLTWLWREVIITRPYMASQVRPYVLSAAAERAVKPMDSFKECAEDAHCPEMIVVPSGSFTMGSPATEKDRDHSEGPQHIVTIAKPFAVSKIELTFADWDGCGAYGDCSQNISDNGFGRGQQPVIMVTWDDAQKYVAWLSQMTGKTYRLLSEAEYEYAARAGTQTAYPWGDEIGKNNADCNGCGSQWDNRRPAPVGSFAANRFGLYDMVGNVFEWVEDCSHNNNDGAPTDGSAWIEGGDCRDRVVRGGSWSVSPDYLRSASRLRLTPDIRNFNLGFRLGRTLVVP
jgi:formylglycine-generating enzyme required for sulfatase activity